MLSSMHINLFKDKFTAQIYIDLSGEPLRFVSSEGDCSELYIKFDDHNKWLHALHFFNVELVVDSRNGSSKELSLSEFIEIEFEEYLKP